MKDNADTKADTKAKRTTLTIRFTPEQLARANAVAEHHGLNVSAAVRMLLKAEERKLGLTGATP